MTEQVQAHKPCIPFAKLAQSELGAGHDLALRITIACPNGCDLRGKPIKMVDHDGYVLGQVELACFDGSANSTDEFVVATPVEPGEYALTAEFVTDLENGVLHQAPVLPIRYAVKPHATHLVILDSLAPMALDSKFRIRVRVMCDDGCDLTGQKVAVYNDEETKVAIGVLTQFLEDAQASFMAEIELAASSRAGEFPWTVRFSPLGLELPHEECSGTMHIRTVNPPEQAVSVQACDLFTHAPLCGARVILRPLLYRGVTCTVHTDENGWTQTTVPEGEYMIVVSAPGYMSYSIRTDITGDLTVDAVLRAGSDVHDLLGNPLQEA